MVIEHGVQRNSIIPTGQGGKLRQGIWRFFIHIQRYYIYIYIKLDGDYI